MKKTVIYIALVAIGSATLVSCGSSKQTAASQPESKVIALNPCEVLQEQHPAIRAVGRGTHFMESTAKNLAENQARGAFARAIATRVKTSTSEDALGYNIFSADKTTSERATDAAGKQNDFVTGIANEIVRNTVVIKTHKERAANDQYDIWVCVEYTGDVAKMADAVAKAVQQRIPDDVKMKMNFEFDKYRQQIQAEIEKYDNSNQPVAPESAPKE